MYKTITTTDLKKYIGNVNIIDIRDSYLFKQNRIPTSINIPINYLLMNPDNYLNKKEIYYIYCTSGMQSQTACNVLINKGYNVVNVLGGFNEYISN